jgi:hypothetical protein
MPAYFLLPDEQQVQWMIARRLYGHYLRFLTSVHDALCLYGDGHGFPHGLLAHEDMLDHQRRMLEALESDARTIPSTSDTARQINRECDLNRSVALAVLRDCAGTKSTNSDATRFLDDVMASYQFVLRKLRPRTGRSRS